MHNLTAGDRVRVTGARRFTGTILGTNDRVMAIALDAQDHTIHLKRDPASTTPEQWRYAGLPVQVALLVLRPEDFGRRLTDLYERTSEKRATAQPDLDPEE